VLCTVFKIYSSVREHLVIIVVNLLDQLKICN